MATEELNFEKKQKHKKWIKKNISKIPKLSRVELESFIQTKITDSDWVIFKVHFSVCKECECEDIQIDLIEEEYGFCANINCLECKNSYLLMLHTNLLL